MAGDRAFDGSVGKWFQTQARAATLRRRMADRRIVDLLTELPQGRRVWLSAAGLSMWPLLLPGDSVRVLRCRDDDLAVGDVAVVRYPHELLVAHLVVATKPVRTSSSVGTPDRPGAVVVGRVVELRRGRVRVPLPRRLRHLFRFLPPVAGAVRRLPLARRLVRLLRRG